MIKVVIADDHKLVREAWNLLLPTIATPEWVAQWRASDWASRRRPQLSGEPPEDGSE